MFVTFLTFVWHLFAIGKFSENAISVWELLWLRWFDCVIFVERATDEMVLGLGPQIERDERFPNRTNVEFVEVVDRGHVRQRTWERGSGETLACGTGASAVCVAGVLTDRTERQITNQLLGGDLELEWGEDNHVYMTGPAEELFRGDWNLES